MAVSNATLSVLFRSIALASLLAGCATKAHISSPAARRPSSVDTVTRENPAGDASSPVDAALTRLLEEPMGYKRDRFGSLFAYFSDVPHWKRVKYWGYPTRAGFRYGKDAYAAAIVLYFEQEDDSPQACLDTFARRSMTSADLFDVQISGVERLQRRHLRGRESISREAFVAGLDQERKRRARVVARLRKRQAALRERRRRARLARSGAQCSVPRRAGLSRPRVLASYPRRRSPPSHLSRFSPVRAKRS
ncbi:MAG: hypothetical protein AAGA56_18615, partial [Myxococcota bacterium]